MNSHEKEFSILKDKIKNTEIFSLKEIIDLMPGNVYWKNLEGKYLGCNENMAAILKMKPADIINKTIYDLIDKKYADYISKITYLISHRSISVVNYWLFSSISI